MRLTYSWLLNHIDGDVTLNQIIDALTNMGLEVESVTNEAERLKDFIVANITATRPHPDADRLKICTVETGEKTLEIVCGGKNARAGIQTILARVGVMIPSTGQVLKSGKIRGVDSPGMLCSSEELLIDYPCDGILELDTGLIAGSPAALALHLDDPVIDISITPNRADCFSALGIARDLAAYLKAQGTPIALKPMDPISLDCQSQSVIEITNHAPQLCYHFGLSLVKDLVNKSSPLWMSKQLRAVGMRPISALVDITNYICMDWGRPLHVFDADKIQGHITLREAIEGESFEALDDKTYTLSTGMLVICDDAGVISLAGVMGGKRTACTEDTKNVLIESAWFNPVNIATTGQKLNLLSDARTRFERGVDPLLVEEGMKRAIAMTLDLCGGMYAGTHWIQHHAYETKTIMLTLEKLEKMTGDTFEMTDVESALVSLGCKMTDQTNTSLTVAVPSWRHDLFEDVDLIEEIVRLRGVQHIKEVRLPAPLKNSSLAKQSSSQLCASAFVSLGYIETINFSFIDKSAAELFAENGKTDALIHLKNPITADLTTMRPSLLPSLLMLASQNQKRDQEIIPIFETAHVYGKSLNEQQSLRSAALWSGKTHERHWEHPRHDIDVFEIKNHLLSVLSSFNLREATLQITTDALPTYYHPGRAGVVKQGQKIIAAFGEIHPVITKHFDIKGAVCGFEIMMENLPPLKQKRGISVALPPFQPVSRDFAFIVDADFPAGKLIHILSQKLTRQQTFPKNVILESIDLFDVFEGQEGTALAGQKSLAVRLKLQPEKATLSETDLDQIMTTVITLAEKDTGAILRQQ